MSDNPKKLAMYKELEAIDIDGALGKAEDELEELTQLAAAATGMTCALREIVVEADPALVPHACKRIRLHLNAIQSHAEKAINHLSFTKPLEQEG